VVNWGVGLDVVVVQEVRPVRGKFFVPSWKLAKTQRTDKVSKGATSLARYSTRQHHHSEPSERSISIHNIDRDFVSFS
jgi:hypothetical protein